MWYACTFKNIGNLDENLEKLTTTLEMSIDWRDESLAWNATAASGIDSITMDRDEVWVPGFFVFNHHYHVDYGTDEKRYVSR